MAGSDLPLLQVARVNKHFSGVQVLYDISLSVRRGEVVALAGENGAGKSTLVKIISGAVSRDDGELSIAGEQLPLQYSPSDAHKKYGVAMIYQEISLLPELTVAENIFLTHEPQRVPWLGLIHYKRMNESAKKILKRLNADHIDVTAKVMSLSLPEQHMVEFAKALAFECKIFIMDEPTTSLSTKETKELFNVIRALKQQEVTIIYISHHLEELFEVVDRVVVLRDGKIVAKERLANLDKERLIELMTGRKISYHKHTKEDDKNEHSLLLEVEALEGKKFPHPISFQLRENEVLGFGGLLGAKRSELARAIFGADKHKGGSIKLKNHKLNIYSPAHAVRNGIGYLSENRKEEGLSLGMSIQENIIHANMPSVTKRMRFSWSAVRAICASFIRALSIKGTNEQKVYSLSGGNQQKVSFAKWIHAKCQVLIFDEPTRGVDVGTKAEIHTLIRDFAQETDKAAIVISTEVAELVAVCDRILVMSKGEITSELVGEQISEDILLHSVTK